MALKTVRAVKRTAARYSKKIVALCIISINLFIAVGVVLAINQIYLSDAWVYCTFGFYGAEAGVLGWIKTSENKKPKTTTNEEAQG